MRFTFVRILSALLLTASLLPVYSAPQRVMQPLWNVQLPSTFWRMDINEEGNLIVVSLEFHPGNTMLIAYDNTGEEVWRYTAAKGKVIGGGLSTDGSRVLCYEYNEEDGKPKTIVRILDGASGKERASRIFAGILVSAKLNADGTAILCKESEGGVVGLFDATEKGLPTLWTIQDIKVNPIGGIVKTGFISTDGRGVILLQADERLIYVNRKGQIFWEVTTDIPVDDINTDASLSTDGGSIAVYQNKAIPWMLNPKPIEGSNVEIGRLRRYYETRLITYQFDTADIPTVRALSALGWESSINNDVSIRQLKTIISNDAQYTIVAFPNRLILHRFPLIREPPVFSIEIVLAELKPDASIQFAIAKKTPIVAILYPTIADEKENRTSSLLTVRDLQGLILAEHRIDGLPTEGIGGLALSSDGTLIYTVANNTLYAFSMDQGK